MVYFVPNDKFGSTIVVVGAAAVAVAAVLVVTADIINTTDPNLRGGVSQSSNYVPRCIKFIQKLFLSNSSGIAGFPSGMSK
jgi:hypothetical protein